MDDNAKLHTCLQYLRRKFYIAASGTWDIPAIRTLADKAFEEASETVTITTTSTEAGGMAGGERSFDKMILLQACEALLLEVDPTGTPPVPPSGSIPDFSSRFTET